MFKLFCSITQFACTEIRYGISMRGYSCAGSASTRYDDNVSLQSEIGTTNKTQANTTLFFQIRFRLRLSCHYRRVQPERGHSIAVRWLSWLLANRQALTASSRVNPAHRTNSSVHPPRSADRIRSFADRFSVAEGNLRYLLDVTASTQPMEGIAARKGIKAGLSQLLRFVSAHKGRTACFTELWDLASTVSPCLLGEREAATN